MYITSGTRLTYVAKWTETGVILWTSGVSDILQNVKTYLWNNYQLAVEAEKVQAPSVAFGSLDETITLQVRTDIDRGSEQDIVGNIDDAFALYGERPTSSNLQSVRAPGQAPQGTGAPAPDTSGENVSGASWFSSLTDKLEGASVGFVFGAIVVVGLLVYVTVKP